MQWRVVFPALLGLAVVFGHAQQVMALDEVIYRAAVEKNKVKVGEKFQYLVRVDFGYSTMAPDIKAPSFVQLNVLSENEKVQVEGDTADKFMIKKKVWLLEATEPGRISIASAIVTYQDPTTNLLKTGKTDIIFIEVESTGENQAETDGAAAPAGTTGTAQGYGRWAGIAAGVLVVLAGLGIFIRRGSAPPKIPPENVALDNLQAALAKVEEEDLTAYFAQLSRTLLDYLQDKFELDAHVLSTENLLERIKTFGVRPEKISALEEFFRVADKAKFAGYTPDEDEMIKLHGSVTQFIEMGRTIKLKKKKPVKQKKHEDD